MVVISDPNSNCVKFPDYSTGNGNCLFSKLYNFMNYLAHLFLAGEHQETVVGNFIADHVKGDSIGQFNNAVREGILMHRLWTPSPTAILWLKEVYCVFVRFTEICRSDC
jgi:hypothetical protein